MAAPVPPGAPRPGSNTPQPPPPNYVPNIRGSTPDALADNMHNLNLNRPPMTSNPGSRPPSFGQPPPPFPSSAASPGIPGSSLPFSRPGPPPGAMVRPAGPPTGQPTFPPNVAHGRPTGPPLGQPPSFVSRPPPGSHPPAVSGAAPVSGVPGGSPQMRPVAPPPMAPGARPSPSPSPFASPPLSAPPAAGPGSASGNLMNNGPPVFSAGPLAGGPQRFPVGSVTQPPVGPPPTMRAPPGPAGQPQPSYPMASQGIMQPPSSPFGAPPSWQMQSQQVALLYI